MDSLEFGNDVQVAGVAANIGSTTVANDPEKLLGRFQCIVEHTYPTATTSTK